VRVLLDENVPHDLKTALVGHDVVTVQGLGWSGTLNGELLKRASGTIEAFVALDRKLESQHSTTSARYPSASSSSALDRARCRISHSSFKAFWTR